jgi:hypothetical protein
MDPQPAFAFQDFLSNVIGDMATAVSERSGEDQDQQFARSRAAAHMIMGFQPRDVTEAMLAGHCVMLHEIMTSDVRTMLRDDTAATRHSAGSSVVRLNKAFNDNLDRLQRYQRRSAECDGDVPEAEAATLANAVSPPQPPGETIDPPQPEPVARGPNRAARRQAARAGIRATAAAPRAVAKPGVVRPQAQPPAAAHTTADRPSSAVAELGAIGSPSPAAVASGAVNQNAAIAALKSGDAAGFARALGVAHPSEAFLAAANAKDSPFNPEATGPWPNAGDAASAIT